MREFFRSFVAPATPGLADTNSDPFHGVCYMWWDILSLRPFRGDSPVGEPELHDACLKAMSEILELRSDVCRISALHGLNHWQENYRDTIESHDQRLSRTCAGDYATHSPIRYEGASRSVFVSR